MSVKELVHMREAPVRQPRVSAVAFQCASSYFASDEVTGVVSEHRAKGGDRHNFPEVEMSLRGEEASREENRFARHRDARVFEHDAEEDYPVAVVTEVGKNG